MTRALMSFGRVVGQALDGIGGRPWRSLATVAVVALVVAAAIAVPGVARTNEVAITQTFLATRGDYVTFRPPDGQGTVTVTPRVLDRLAERPEVLAWGGLLPVNGVVAQSPLLGAEESVSVVAVYGDIFSAMGTEPVRGTTWSAAMASSGVPVVVVGAGAAQRLQLGPVDGRTSILVGGVSYLVLGVSADSSALGTSDVVMAPYQALSSDFPTAVSTVSVAVARSAPEDLAPVAQIGARLLAPEHPDLVATDYSLGAQQLADIVTARLGTATLALAGLGAGVSGIVVLALMSSAVAVRRPEIGLRRSLGARRSQVVGQFLVEGSVLGAIGAGCGVALGLAGAALMAPRGVPLMFPENIVLLVLGGVIAASTLACVPPAWRAGAVDPVDALSAAD